MTLVCSEPNCSAVLKPNPRRKGTRCQPCAARINAQDPARRAKLSAAMKTRFEDPAFRQQHRKRAGDGLRRALKLRPELREQMRAQGKRVGDQFGGKNWGSAGSPMRMQIGRKTTEFWLGWCPDRYRSEYRKLVSTDRMLAIDARKVIEEQIARDAARAGQTEPPPKMSSFDRQMAAVRGGARLIDKPDLRKADPAYTLGGIGSGML